MFIQKYRLQNEADQGEGSSGEPTLTADQVQNFLSRPEVKAAIDSSFEEKTAGLKKNSDKILAELKAEREKNKQLDGLDVDNMRAMLKKFKDDEEKALLEKGQIEEVVQRRANQAWEQKQADYESTIEGIKTESENNRQRGDRFESLYEKEKVGNALSLAASKAGVLPGATEDVLLHASEVWRVNHETGEIEARDKDGKLIMNKEGTTKMTPSDYIDSLRESKPHYWGETNGAGAFGSSGGKGNASDLLVLMKKAAEVGDTQEYNRLKKLRREKMATPQFTN